jgi:hypothetical protein
VDEVRNRLPETASTRRAFAAAPTKNASRHCMRRSSAWAAR